MICLRHGQYRSAKAATAAASATGHSAINAETTGFNIPKAEVPWWARSQPVLFAPAALPDERRDRTDNTRRCQSGKRIDFGHGDETSVTAYRHSHQYSKREPNPHCEPAPIVIYVGAPIRALQLNL